MNIIDYLTPLLIGGTSHLILNYILNLTIKLPLHFSKIENKKQKQKKLSEFFSNYTCILHAIIMTLYGIQTTIFQKEYRNHLSKTDTQFYLFSIGYNIYDIIYEYRAGLLDINYLTHHTIVIIMSGHSIYFDKNSFIINLTYFIGEVTNPFICLHKNFNLYPNLKNISEILGLVFCLLFLIIRVVVCTFLMLYGNTVHEISYFVCFIGNIMVYIGYQWSFEVFNKMLKAVNRYIVDEKGECRDLYGRFKVFRSSRVFKFVFQSVIFLLCFVPLALNSHDEYI